MRSRLFDEFGFELHGFDTVDSAIDVVIADAVNEAIVFDLQVFGDSHRVA